MPEPASFSGITSAEHLYLEVTERCDLNCPYCSVRSWRNHTQDPDYDVLCSLLSGFRTQGGRFVTLSGGEPGLRPDIGNLVLRAGNLGLAVTLFTNGRAVSPEVLRSMRAVSGLLAVSLDGPNADVHEVLRGKKTFASAYASFVKGLNYLGGDRVILSCLLSRALLPQIDELWDFAQQHGVGVLYLDLFEPLRSYRRSPQAPEIRELIAPVLHLLDKAERQGRPRLLFSESHDLIDVQAAFSSRDVKKILGRTIKVQADGWALPGPFYYDACFRLGRPAEHGWPPILNSAVYHHLKELAITRKQMVEACGRCFWSHRCGGGSLALTWATYGHWTAACPLCELYQATLERAARRQMSHESALFARKPSFGAGARA